MINVLGKVRIHPLFWFIIGAGILTGHFKEVLMILLIVFIHEMGHASAANRLGWEVQKIELLPFGGAAVIEANGIRPIKEEIIIVLAGPFQHLWLMPLSFFLVGQPFWSIDDHRLFIAHNVAILLFNLLPIFPLDGGRLLQLYCLHRMPYKQGMKVSYMISLFCLLLSMLVLCFFPFHLNLVVILSFLITANYFEFKQRNYRFMRFLMAKQEDLTSRSTRVIELKPDALLRDAVHLLKRNQLHTFIIKGTTSSAEINEKELLHAYFQQGVHAPINTLIAPPF